MNFQRKKRFEPRRNSQGEWVVWDLMFSKFYKPYGQELTDQDEADSVKRCENLQRMFEFANPLPFLDESESGSDFMGKF